MKRLNHYLFKTVLFSILGVLLVICALDMLSKIIDELSRLTESYTFGEVLIHAGLLVPVSIYRYMPFAALVGSLIGLGSLAATSELTAMRAAGVSILQITLSVLKPVMVLIVVTLLLAEYVVPPVEDYAGNRRSLKLEGVKSAQASSRGLWNREGNEFMHFNSVQGDGSLLGVTRYQYDGGKQLVSSSFAERVSYRDGNWLEENVIQSNIGDKQVSSESVASRVWNIQLSPALLTILVQNSDNLAISKLYQYIAYLDQQNIDSRNYRLSFWNKVLQPLAIISLVLVALSFVFGSLREVTMGYRIFIGVVVGVSFQIAQKLLGPTSLVYVFPPAIAVAVPIVICFFLGLLLLSRKRYY